MVVDVVMPKMGESIMEGTILEWYKKVGDSIEKDETLLEIGTDKVDSEIPSPASGTISEILANPNDIVDIGKVIARIDTTGSDLTLDAFNNYSLDTSLVMIYEPCPDSDEDIYDPYDICCVESLPEYNPFDENCPVRVSITDEYFSADGVSFDIGIDFTICLEYVSPIFTDSFFARYLAIAFSKIAI